MFWLTCSAQITSGLQSGQSDASLISAPKPQTAPPNTTSTPLEAAPTPEANPADVLNQDALPEQEALPDSNYGNSFQITAQTITVRGVTLYDEDTIKSWISSYKGKTLDIEALKALTNAINTRYHQDGFYTSQAIIPPQRFEQGEIIVQVMEGSIGDIRLKDDPHFYRARVLKRDLGLHPGEKLNITELGKTLNRVNLQHFNQYRLKANLTPGKETGTTDIQLEVQEKQPWQLSPTWDNQGRPFIGSMRGGIDLQNRNLLGFGDRLFTRWTAATGTQLAMVNYAVPLNRLGTELSYGYTFAFVDIDIPIHQQRTYYGYGNNHTLTLTQPLDPDRVWTVDASFNAKRSSSRYGGFQIQHDDVRSATLGLNFNKFNSVMGTFARLQSDVGGTWFSGNRPFWKASAAASHWHRLPHNHLLILRGNAQVTPDGLPGVESMQIGGAYSIHGFTEGVRFGDRGYALGIEHRWPIPGLNKLSPWLYERVQGASIFEMGQVFLDKSNLSYLGGYSNTSARSTLAGIGLGLRFYLTQYLSGFVDVGFPVTKNPGLEPNAQPNARLHFGLRSDLLPQTFQARK